VRPLARAALAELVGTGLLVAIVVGSGIMAVTQSPHDVGLQLLENSITTALGLGVLIVLLGPVSGAHLNPAVTLAAWALARRAGDGPSGRTVAAYLPAQVLGGIGGAILANLMFGLPAATAATHDRSAPHLWLGEIVATAGLVAVVFALNRQNRAQLAPLAVGAYIGAAYWFTSSTSFANPAVTLGRAFSNTFAGIAPRSVPGFLLAQLVGAIVGVALVALLYPRDRLADGRASPDAPSPAAPSVASPVTD
jgi:arsenate reductase